ncbi:unnamed protein product [Alopecurus aequalis]
MGRKGRSGPARLKEDMLLRVTTALQEFQASGEQVYTFEPNLSNGERATIHSMCRKMGMRSKSSGNGARRCLSVYKCKNKDTVKEEGPSRLGFSEEATQVLLDLFTHYPPDDAELNGDAVKESGDKAARVQWKTDGSFYRPTMQEHDIVKKVEILTSKMSKQLKKIAKDRSKLPISSFKEHICSTLENHQVVLISGETGCGKTTQVPQYILDHVWGKGESCKIICTQPRRISAVSVAERISAERGESVGDTVGYKIRLESKGGKNSSIMFCTNGVLLRVLIGRVTNVPEAQNVEHSFDDALMGITHIIVDEIHERDRFSDFMLAILRDLLPIYPHLHLVLMSATIDADRFSQYFNGCPVIEVPGHTYPVKTFYLEDVLSVLQSVDDNHLRPASDDLQLKSVLTDEYKSSMDEVISMALVNDEFDPLIELISVEQNPEVFNYSHSETDSGRMKEKSYDPYNSVSTLQTSWVSRASARQREGRAGRCQPGTCYHLYSKLRAASLSEFQTPEIKRMPIEELCLQVKLLDPDCKIADFLKKTLDPPIPETVKNAITVLQDLGALTQDEQLTDLGEKLGSLPVHPSTSKMLLFGILMNCLDPALTLACAADYRDPFVLPVDPNQRKKAAAAKVELASLYGGFSDQLAVLAAFECWRRAKERGQEAMFCSVYFVAANTMNMLSSMRKQLQNELAQRGFLPANASACSTNAKSPGIISAVLMAGAYPMVGQLLPPRKNVKSAVVETASGAKVRLHPHSLNFNLSLNKSSGSPLIIYDEITRGDGGMYIKNCSVVGSYPLLLLASEMAVAPPDYSDEEEEGSSADEAEENSSGRQKGEIMSSPDNTVTVVVDRWLRFHATALDVAQIYCLRERLASAILFKVKYPRRDLPPALGATICAITDILAYDGLPAMVPVIAGGHIRPSGFLTSLMSDIVIPPNVPQFGRSSNHSGGASGHIRSDRNDPRNRTGPGTSAPQSSKRQRDSARRPGPE